MPVSTFHQAEELLLDSLGFPIIQRSILGRYVEIVIGDDISNTSALRTIKGLDRVRLENGIERPFIYFVFTPIFIECRNDLGPRHIEVVRISCSTEGWIAWYKDFTNPISWRLRSIEDTGHVLRLVQLR